MQNDKLKKIIPVIIILALIGLGLLAYFLFFRGTSVSTDPNLPISGDIDNNNGNQGNNNGSTGGTAGDNDNDNGNNTGGAFKPQLRLVSPTPTSGGITFSKENMDYTRFVERAKGNAYETEAKNIRPQRLTNNTIPQIYNAYWTKNGNQLVGQYLRDQEKVQTFLGNVKDKVGGDGELQTQFLNGTVGDVVFSPNNSQVAYINQTEIGSSVITSNLSLQQKLEIFSSPLNDWLIDWPEQNNLIISSKPAKDIDGLSQTINLKTGEEKLILSDKKGLTTLYSSDLKRVIYSESNKNSFDAYVLSIETNQSLPFRFNTLPEKCVWSQVEKTTLFCAVPETISASDYPEDWYLGTKSFKDEMWKTNVETGETVYLSNLSNDAGEDVDSYKMSLSSNEKFLTFLNKNNLKLYTLQIAE
jgi:hypothetical protein